MGKVHMPSCLLFSRFGLVSTSPALLSWSGSHWQRVGVTGIILVEGKTNLGTRTLDCGLIMLWAAKRDDVEWNRASECRDWRVSLTQRMTCCEIWLVQRYETPSLSLPIQSGCGERGVSGPPSHAHKVLCRSWHWLPQTSLYLLPFLEVENINIVFVRLSFLRFRRGKWSRSRHPLAIKNVEEGPKDVSGCPGASCPRGKLSQQHTGKDVGTASWCCDFEPIVLVAASWLPLHQLFQWCYKQLIHWANIYLTPSIFQAWIWALGTHH